LRPDVSPAEHPFASLAQFSLAFINRAKATSNFFALSLTMPS
jgi:hypothetical protein